MLKLPLDTGDVHKAGFGRRIDEKIEIASLGIFSVQNRSENTGIAAPVLGNNPANLLTMAIQCLGRSHAGTSIEKVSAGDRSRPGAPRIDEPRPLP